MSLTDTASAIPGAPPVAQEDSRLSKVVILYLICVAIPIFFYVGSLYLNTLRALLLVVILPLMARFLMGHYGRLIITDWLFVGYFLWSVMSLAVNNPEAVVQQSGSTGAEFLGGYFVGRAYVRTRAQFVSLCRWLGLIVLFLLPFGLIESQTGQAFLPRLIQSVPGLLSVTEVNIPGRMGLERVQNSFMHPIHYGLFCSVAFSLNFIALKDETGTVWRWLSSTLIGLGCFLALSSGAFLALLLQIALIGWQMMFRRLPWRWWLLVGLGALAYVVVDLLSNRTPLMVFLSYATFSAQTAYWRTLIFEYGLENALNNPIFGIGMNDWIRPSWMRQWSDSVDNFWLMAALRFGFPALIMIAWGYLYVLLKVMFRDLSTDPELWRLRQAWVLSFVGLTFTLCTVHVWANIYSFVFFIFGAGAWLMFEPVGANKGEPAPEAPPPPSGPRYSRFSAETRQPAAVRPAASRQVPDGPRTTRARPVPATGRRRSV